MKNTDEISCPVIPMPSYVGPYKIIKKIGSGGMGEVFLAIDPLCQRELALKKIRSDKLNHPRLRERFLKEVKIAAQLSHPNIIPIYQIHQTDSQIYYTMPLVQGKTLKEIIHTTLKQEKEGVSHHPIGSSIPALMRIFLSICQAIAYSHSKGILHRDLKLENVIIGPYGEVLIIDWGLADFITSEEEAHIESPVHSSDATLTIPGKIAGTLAYLAPERIFGKKASYASDIYSLGVILYQLLTLRLPFRRKSIAQYKKQMPQESIMPPTERSPYRDIPSQLAQIAKKCLAKHPKKRYARVEEILLDLHDYIEGHAKWTPYTTIRTDCKTDWQFQENILFAKHIALTKKSDVMEWVNLMIAKDPFPGKLKIETHIHIKPSSKGVGFVLNIQPNEQGKELLQDSFLIWIGSTDHPGCYLFRSHVELLSNPEFSLQEGLSHAICIEKTDYYIRLYIDKSLVLDYLSHTPLQGPYFGLLLKDAEHDIGALLLSMSSPNIWVSCLAVPDTLFTLHHYKEALHTYRQIAQSFPGRAEGREAIFRSGIVLLEEAKKKKNRKERQSLFIQALEEFSRLSERGGSPLEYIGKSLVYKDSKELTEEIKCLELALRRFAKHPLLHLVKEQILFRLHEASYKDQVAAYEFSLLTLRYFPQAFEQVENQSLLQHLKKNCDPISFLPQEDALSHLSLQLAFWLNKPLTLMDLFQQTDILQQKEHILYCLLYLGHMQQAEKLFSSYIDSFPQFIPIFSCYTQGYRFILSSPSFLHLPQKNPKAFAWILHQFYYMRRAEQKMLVQRLSTIPLSMREQQQYIAYLLYLKKNQEALQQYTFLSPPPFFLQGCIIAATEGASSAKSYFAHSEFAALFSAHPPTKWPCLKKDFFWNTIQILSQSLLLCQILQWKEKHRSIYKVLLTIIGK